MNVQNENDNVTVQGLITPVPAALAGEQTGPQSSISSDRSDTLVSLAIVPHNATSTPTSDPFKRSSIFGRSPPRIVPQETHRKGKEIPDDEKLSKQLKEDEQKTFFELGEKLTTVYGIISNARNIHKPIRDNINCAMALYQQLVKQRDAIGINPALPETRKEMQSKATQVDQKSPTEKSPNQQRRRKRAKTAETIAALQKQDEINIEEVDTPKHDGVKNDWKIVKHRKETRKKKKQQNNRGRITRDQGEAITIRTNTPESYADVLKEMKKNINPTEIGVEIKGIRRTRTGELLLKLSKGEGQAERLKNALGNTLGQDVMIRAVTKNSIIDIRDMDESTEVSDLVSALMKATSTEDETKFKVLNLRDAFGRTKQALVQLPENLAASLLCTGKIRVGWVMCRLRTKIRPRQCYRCLDQGHIASLCNGVDRSNICVKCCNPGHRSRECKGELRCIICQESGSNNTHHYIGSMACVSNRRKQARK